MEIDFGCTTTISACNMGFSNNYHGKQLQMQYDDDHVFSFPAQQPLPVSVDFHLHHAQNYSVNDVPILDEMFLNDPFYSSPQNQLHDANFVVPAEFWNDNNINRTSDWTTITETEKEKKKVDSRKRRRGVDYNKTAAQTIISSKKLSRETISKYFYMTITQAARELNVGLTLLKKRCRELGIRRWPQRKLNSLQTLIKNVQEFRNEGSREESLEENLEILEQEKKLLEEIPDLQLDHTTKRLRQAFFKANYKKRKLMGMIDSPSTVRSQGSSGTAAVVVRENVVCSYEVDFEEEDEELKYLLADCVSCTL